MSNINEETTTVLGVVTETLPNTTFKVTLEGGKETLAYLSGKMRMHRIKVLIGDKVAVLMDNYGSRGRITKRL